MLYLSLILIGLLGYLAQTTGLCMVRGVKEARSGNPMFLLAILFSGALAWLSFGVVNIFSHQAEAIAYQSTWYFAIGGFLFGFGAALNSGCGVSTISRLARGHMVMIATIAGWLFAWCLFALLELEIPLTRFTLPAATHYLILMVISISLAVFILHLNANQKKLWLSMLGIGLMAGVIFIYEPHWTPSGLLKGISFSLWHGKQEQWPDQERFWLIGSLLLGMLIAAVVTKSFKLDLKKPKDYLRHFGAGGLMGFGAVLASGGNDTQLLVALPALSPAGGVAVGSIVIGIYFGTLVKR